MSQFNKINQMLGKLNLQFLWIKMCKIKEKSRLHGKWIRKQPGVEKDLLRNKYARMRNMRNQIKDEIRKSKARYENDIAEKSQTSSKVFWSFIRKNWKSKLEWALFLMIQTTKTQRSILISRRPTFFKNNLQVCSQKNHLEKLLQLVWESEKIIINTFTRSCLEKT